MEPVGICNACWQRIHPIRQPVRLHPTARETEICVGCGDRTNSGIYLSDFIAKERFGDQPRTNQGEG